MMRAKIEAVANVVVIVVALAVGYVLLSGKIVGPRSSRSVSVGDRLAKISGIDWSEHRRTLVLALNTGCHYCQDSAPFYQRLAQAQPRGGRNDLEIVAAFPNDPEAVRQLVQNEGLSIRSVAAFPVESLGVDVFPTLLLVDREGRVERSWVGLLTPRQELELLNMASGLSTGCSAGEGSAFQTDGNKGCSSIAEHENHRTRGRSE